MSDRYTTTVYWHAHEPTDWERERGEPGHQPDPTVHEHTDLDAAERDGARFGCLAGTTRIEVRDPDGILQALWDKTSRVTIKHRRYPDQRGRMTYDVSRVSNRWQRVGEESQALGRRQRDELDALIRAERAAGRPVDSASLAGILQARQGTDPIC